MISRDDRHHPIITRARLNQLRRQLPDYQRAYFLSIKILREYLGNKWIENNIVSSTGGGNYFSLPKVFPEHQESLETLEKNEYRLISLAEMLFNLQFLSGFDIILRKMSHDSLEDTFAEIESAFLLFRSYVPVRFIKPVGSLGKDYDLEIQLRPGVMIAADTKNKAEGLTPSVSNICKALSRAPRQLPRDRPSFIFLRVPSSWAEDEFVDILKKGVGTFFEKGNNRVASVKIHSRKMEFVSPTLCLHNFPFLQYDNPRCRFKTSMGWTIQRQTVCRNVLWLSSFGRTLGTRY